MMNIVNDNVCVSYANVYNRQVSWLSCRRDTVLHIVYRKLFDISSMKPLIHFIV